MFLTIGFEVPNSDYFPPSRSKAKHFTWILTLWRLKCKVKDLHSSPLLLGKKKALSADKAVEFIFCDLCGVHKLPSFKFPTSVFTREPGAICTKCMSWKRGYEGIRKWISYFHNVTSSYQNQSTALFVRLIFKCLSVVKKVLWWTTLTKFNMHSSLVVSL